MLTTTSIEGAKELESLVKEGVVSLVKGKVIDVDATHASRITQPMLSTRYGGSIATSERSQELVPTEPRFRVRIALDELPESLRETRGSVVIEGRRYSLLAESLQGILAVLIRESGF